MYLNLYLLLLLYVLFYNNLAYCVVVKLATLFHVALLRLWCYYLFYGGDKLIHHMLQWQQACFMTPNAHTHYKRHIAPNWYIYIQLES